MTDVAVAAPPRPMHGVFAAVWMAILLGLALQGVILAAKLGVGAQIKGVQAFIDIIGGVTWSLIVCAGVAIGTVAARSTGTVMGLLGLVCAPLAFAAAKGVQRGAQWVLGQPTDKITDFVVQTGLIKTVEYAALGYALGLLIRTAASTLRNHAALGALFGLVFGGAILFLNAQHPPLPPPKAVGVALNEFVFPIGCSLVIYWVAKLSDRGSAMERVISGGG